MTSPLLADCNLARGGCGLRPIWTLIGPAVIRYLYLRRSRSGRGDDGLTGTDAGATNGV